MRRSILFTKLNTAELIEEESQSLDANQVRVKIERTAISAGTERANLMGDTNTSIYAPKSEVAIFPRRVGYSASGIVAEVGDSVTRVKVGDRVAISWSCHSTECVVNETRVYKLPDSVSFEAAALVHIATFPAAAIRKTRLEFGESALVMGLGILGLIAVSLLRAAGACPIIAVDPVLEKRNKALELGADYALSPYEENFAEKVKELTSGGAAVAIEVTGVGAGLNGALDCMKKFGRVALLGCTRDSDFTVDYYRKVHGPGISLIGAHTLARPSGESSSGAFTERDEAEAIIKLIANGRLNFDSLVEEIRSPKETREVFDRLINDKFFPILEFDWSRL